MIIKKLVAIVQEISANNNYEFHLGAERQINSRVRKMPALWLEFPSMCEMEGREEGSVSYELCIHLLQKTRPNESEKQSAELEADALNLIRNLWENSAVRDITDVEMSIENNKFPPLAEMSLSLEFEISMDFNTKKQEND